MNVVEDSEHGCDVLMSVFDRGVGVICHAISSHIV